MPEGPEIRRAGPHSDGRRGKRAAAVDEISPAVVQRAAARSGVSCRAGKLSAGGNTLALRAEREPPGRGVVRALWWGDRQDNAFIAAILLVPALSEIVIKKRALERVFFVQYEITFSNQTGNHASRSRCKAGEVGRF